MSNGRHDRLSRLYLQARERDTGPRERFIAEHCADETTLGNELRAMLLHSADPPEIVRTGAVAGALVSEPEPIPERIGPYEVIDRLGEGGMGVVYRAWQRQPIERQVAVKLIKSGIETRQSIQRFQSEQQVLARLSHPNIVRVFDAGNTADGRVYFAMEHVHGVPITQYCDAERMSTGARIELFLIVCRAVQHAHHNAIIHRDIKSSNVLVTAHDGEPSPKIIDFGVSKTLSATPGGTGVTRLGQMIGTLEHMSPEQTSSDSRDVDTRTDVYALGILLYELMVGALPFFTEDGGAVDIVEAVRRIREEDPRSPSDLFRRGGRSAELASANRNTDLRGLRRQLRGDIDTIVAKCLEKDRDRRYGSPAELADDLERHLTHEPISAGGPGFAYRAAKLIRKHRTAFAVAFVLGIGGAAFAYSTIRHSSQMAEEQRRADIKEEQATIVSSYLEGLFDLSGRSEFRTGAVDPEAMFEHALSGLPDLEEHPLLHARLLGFAGAWHSSLGRPHKGIQLLEQSVRQLENLRGASDLATLGAQHHLAVAYGRARRFVEGEALLDSVAASRSDALGALHPSVLGSRLEQGVILKQMGRYDDAERVMADALSGMRTVHGRFDESTLVCASFLASIYLEQRRYAEVERMLEPLVGPMADVLGTDHLEFRAVQYNLAAAALGQGDRERALVLLEGLPGGPPTDPRRDEHFEPLWNTPRLEAVGGRGMLALPRSRADESARMEDLITLKSYASAEQIATRAFEACRAYLGLEHPDTEQAIYNVVRTQLLQGHLDEPTRMLEELLARQRQRLGEGSWVEFVTLWWLGDALAASGRIAEATRVMKRVYTLHSAYGDQPATARMAKAAYLSLAGDLDGALAVLPSADSRPIALSLEASVVFARLRGHPEFEALLEAPSRSGRPIAR